jgi:hypothetical protein
MTAAILAALLDALKYLWVGRSLHVEKSGRALLQPAQAVIDENISPRNLRLEFDHRRPAGRDQGGLYIAEGLGRPFRMDLVENLADDVKANRSRARSVRLSLPRPARARQLCAFH